MHNILWHGLLNLHGFVPLCFVFLQGSMAHKAEEIMNSANFPTLELEMDYDLAAQLAVKRAKESKGLKNKRSSIGPKENGDSGICGA